MDEVLEWLNYLRASAYPGCEVSCRWVLNWPQSSLYLCYVNPSPTVEKAVAIVLESRPTDIASLPTFCSILCSTRILHCNRGMLQMRQRMGMCETLMVVPYVHQNDHSYVRELSWPTKLQHHLVICSCTINMQSWNSPTTLYSSISNTSKL